MNTAIKIGCLVLYAMAIASLAGLLPASYSHVVTVAAIILAAHAIEVVVMFKHVKKYEGPLAVSVLLTLLFGLAHWTPLAKKPA